MVKVDLVAAMVVEWDGYMDLVVIEAVLKMMEATRIWAITTINLQILDT